MFSRIIAISSAARRPALRGLARWARWESSRSWRTTPRPVTAAYGAALELLDRPDRPTALLCFSDVFAAQAIRAAGDLGLHVPADLSVVGYDDADLASTTRPH